MDATGLRESLVTASASWGEGRKVERITAWPTTHRLRGCSLKQRADTPRVLSGIRGAGIISTPSCKTYKEQDYLHSRVFSVLADLNSKN